MTYVIKVDFSATMSKSIEHLTAFIKLSLFRAQKRQVSFPPRLSLPESEVGLPPLEEVDMENLEEDP